MTNELATRGPLTADIEKVMIGGDLKTLKPEERLNYYNAVCSSLGLNPLTKPFSYIELNGKLQLYALKDCTEQLRKIHGVSITQVDPKQIGDLLVVVASAADRDGRVDSSTGAVNIAGLKGEALANAMMKAETKSKRRVTLSLCGLGMLDETEVQTLREQGVATEPEGNKWEAPPNPTQPSTSGETHTSATVASPSARGSETVNSVPSEPDIRPRSQKGAQPTTQPPQASQGQPQPQQQAIEGQVVGTEPVISEKQRRMLFAISKSADLSDDQVKAALGKVGIHCHRDSIPKALFQKALDAIDPQQKFHTNR